MAMSQARLSSLAGLPCRVTSRTGFFFIHAGHISRRQALTASCLHLPGPYPQSKNGFSGTIFTQSRLYSQKQKRDPNSRSNSHRPDPDKDSSSSTKPKHQDPRLRLRSFLHRNLRTSASFARYPFVLVVLAVVLGLDIIDSVLLSRECLNPRSFAPFRVVGRDQISPSAFVLTLRRGSGWRFALWRGAGDDLVHPTEEVVDEAWRTGRNWSVEVKQPQLQVSREYTPLPLPPGGDRREVRILVRRVNGGEVSGYLDGLRVGDLVELRGPHLGFDVRERLGDGERVVFLAGGTGIAPALQVARALTVLGSGLDGGKRESKAKVDIVWANRSRKDCEGCEELAAFKRDVSGRGTGQGPILGQLAEWQARYPGRISVRCTVDEEKSFIDSGAIARATGLDVSSRSGTKMEFDDECWIHSQDKVALRPGTETDGDREKCKCRDGKNLLYVSGPDGFIEAYAGPKNWADGKELQGPLGGLLGSLKWQYPEFWRDWLVLKL